jgi:xylulokinase
MGYGAGKLVKWLRLTGGLPGHSGKDSIAHILFLMAERPEVYARAAKLLEPKYYLNLRLTGRAAASFDSITLHWVTDNRRADRIDYHPDLLRALGLDRAKLPDLKRAVDVLGPLQAEAARDLGAP